MKEFLIPPFLHLVTILEANDALKNQWKVIRISFNNASLELYFKLNEN